MTVTSISGWRLDGCGELCQRDDHDPFAHEVWGRQRALAEAPMRVIRTGPLVVDLNAGVATVNGEPVTIFGREWGVLAYLAERVGCWCPTDEIVAAVWGPEWVNETRYGKHGRATTRLLNVSADRLRTKIGPAGQLLESNRSTSCPARRLVLEAPI